MPLSGVEVLQWLHRCVVCITGVSIYLSCVRLYLLIPLSLCTSLPQQGEIAAERGCFAARGDKGNRGEGVMLCRVVCLYILLLEYCVSVPYEARSGCYDMAGWIWLGK